MDHARLIAHCGAKIIERSALQFLETPPAIGRFKPVAHAMLVDALHEELTARGLVVARERYAIQHEGHRLFGALDLEARDSSAPLTRALGLRTANDKSLSLQIAIGLRVFVCDNMAFSGDLIALKRRHTSGLDLPLELQRALDRYEQGIIALEADVDRMQTIEMTQTAEKTWIYDVFAQKILPVTHFNRVVDTYYNVTAQRYGHTLWALHNAVTTHIGTMAPGPAFKATVALGKFCRM